MKIRLEGTEQEIDWLVKSLKKVYDVGEVSKPYRNRDGKTYRVYVEVTAFFVRSGTTPQTNTDPNEPQPNPTDAVLGTSHRTDTDNKS